MHGILEAVKKISRGPVNRSIGSSALNESKLSFFSDTVFTLPLPLLLPVFTFTLPSNILATISAPLRKDRRTHRGTDTCYETKSCGYQRDPNRRSRAHHRILWRRGY